MYKVVEWLFILTGTKFYMDWVLPTNPTSKNPLIKFMWGFMKNGYSARNYKNRFQQTFVLGGTHLILFFIFWGQDKYVDTVNILVNIYPIIVQLYIGFRCYQVIQHKKKLQISHA